MMVLDKEDGRWWPGSRRPHPSPPGRGEQGTHSGRWAHTPGSAGGYRAAACSGTGGMSSSGLQLRAGRGPCAAPRGREEARLPGSPRRGRSRGALGLAAASLRAAITLSRLRNPEAPSARQISGFGENWAPELGGSAGAQRKAGCPVRDRGPGDRGEELHMSVTQKTPPGLAYYLWLPELLAESLAQRKKVSHCLPSARWQGPSLARSLSALTEDRKAQRSGHKP